MKVVMAFQSNEWEERSHEHYIGETYDEVLAFFKEKEEQHNELVVQANTYMKDYKKNDDEDVGKMFQKYYGMSRGAIALMIHAAQEVKESAPEMREKLQEDLSYFNKENATGQPSETDQETTKAIQELAEQMLLLWAGPITAEDFRNWDESDEPEIIEDGGTDEFFSTKIREAWKAEIIDDDDDETDEEEDEEECDD